MTRDPPRLLEEELAHEQRGLLLAGRRAPDLDFDLEGGARRFAAWQATLAPDLAAPVERVAQGGGAAKSLVSGTGLKLSVALLVVSGAVGALIAARGNPPDPGAPGPARAAPDAPAATTSGLEAATPAAPSASSNPPSSSDREHAAPARRAAQHAPGGDRRAARNAAPRSAAPAGAREPVPGAATQQESAPAAPPGQAGPAAESAVERELIAVARARSLVHTAPKRALDLLGSMVRDFPNGYFREERSALRVIALTEAHSREAIGAAQQHLAAYPNGPFSDRVRQLLERAR